MDKKISIILPAYNEADNLGVLIPNIVSQLRNDHVGFEVLVVDDGSRDNTAERMRDLCASFSELRSLRLRHNEGKSAALAAGFHHSSGDVIVLMDADGQDDPTEIPKLLAALDNGADLVTGRRAIRNDRFIKRSTSKLYNAATAKLGGVEGKDFNSGFKAMKSKVAKELDLYGELHRYIPVLAHWMGFATTEVDVVHHARLHGESKFGVARFWRGLFDLVTVRFLASYRRRPLHIFGGLGLIIGAVGVAILTWMTLLKAMGQSIGDRPALLAGVLMVFVAVQLFSTGLLGELMISLGRRNDRHPPVEIDQ